MVHTTKSPVFLNLFQIRFPVTAVLSIGHRVSGVVLFFCTPLFIYLLDLSLSGEEGFAAAGALLDSSAVRLLGAILIWAFAHHLYAGVRYLLLDLDLGVERSVARSSAWLVLGAGTATFLLSLWWLFS